MKIIAEIKEQDINPNAPLLSSTNFSRRESVRAIVTDPKGRVALLHVANRGFHKLPGGGIESNEDRFKALDREVMEEIGCHIDVIDEIGQVIEYRDEWEQVQTSFCYLAKQVGLQKPNSLTESEQNDGFEIVWVNSIDEAITTLEGDNPAGYDGKRMKPRDLAILKSAKKLLI